MADEIRIDKWLWTVRLFKTRSLATEACKKGRIFISNVAVKPSRMIKKGDIIDIKRPPIIYSFKVLEIANNRMNARLVPQFMEDITSSEQLELIELAKLASESNRVRGTGRPTKKERRDLEDFIQPYFLDDEDDY